MFSYKFIIVFLGYARIHMDIFKIRKHIIFVILYTAEAYLFAHCLKHSVLAPVSLNPTLSAPAQSFVIGQTFKVCV